MRSLWGIGGVRGWGLGGDSGGGSPARCSFALYGLARTKRTKRIVAREGEVQTKKQSINPRMANPQIDNDGCQI